MVFPITEIISLPNNLSNSHSSDPKLTACVETTQNFMCTVFFSFQICKCHSLEKMGRGLNIKCITLSCFTSYC